MEIQNIPKIYLKNKTDKIDLFIYDFKMTDDVVKSKVNLGLHMFSFLQTGKKQIHFADTSVAVDKSQSILIKKGNSLWTELIDKESAYYCKLFFFSEEKLRDFLEKHSYYSKSVKEELPFFIIENDTYIMRYLDSLSSIDAASSKFNKKLLPVKFEELMVYLICKYGSKFEMYLHSLVSKEISPIKSIIEKNIYSNLKLEEIAFLCNMSLSTFKRHFINEYQTSPGKWFQDKRLHKAKELLTKKNIKISDVHKDLGYNSLSNFSAAFKNKFGFYPREATKM